MRIEELQNISLSVGHGENAFTMNRGSFKYKQKIRDMIPLLRTQITDEADGFTITYSDKRSKDVYKIKVAQSAQEQDADGLITVELTEMADPTVNRFWLTLPAYADEHIYGCGETHAKLDIKGENVRIFVAEHQNTDRISRKIIRNAITGVNPERTADFTKYESYYAQPTYTSSKRYFVHADLSRYAELNFSNPEETTIYAQERPKLYIGNADSFEALAGKLANLLGYQRRLPDWIYDGGILAIQDWKVDEKGKTVSAGRGCEIVDEKITKALADGVKINGVWCQDWCGCRCTGFGYQVMWNWQYDNDKYTDLPTRIAKWKEQGVRFLGYINPFIAIEKNLYQEAYDKGYLVLNKEGEPYLVTITTFPAAMVDLTNPAAYEWYKDIIKKNMIGIGMGGWMADFGEYLPVDAVLYSGEDPEAVHNRWPAIWAKLNREAIDEAKVAGEVFFFTRAGYTETIKYSTMMWTGDHHVDWSVDDGMAAVIPATLSLAMSGYGITHSDVGGYTTILSMTRDKELLMRWEEMNAFSPLFRSHEGNQPGRNVQVGDDPELVAQLAKCTQMHSLLKDYLKEAVDELAERALPVMRPLFFYYDEPRAYTIKSEYLLGRDVLVAPVIKRGVDTKRVYLPEDDWVHLFSGEEFTGGEYLIDAPIGEPPVFIRKAAIDKFSNWGILK